ncbi:hypothetical protein [Marinitoga lauensis]|uniref:hypothetical protein n=1 Tax=Marinitoga lauensis TaxID=2201189 RepID=UPI001012812D|nr:hypothetical protein [Marinitoga lauensis]
MKKIIIIIAVFIYSILAFSTNFSKSNSGYYEIPAYRPFLGFKLNKGLFDINTPFLLANIEYKEKIIICLIQNIYIKIMRFL